MEHILFHDKRGRLIKLFLVVAGLVSAGQSVYAEEAAVIEKLDFAHGLFQRGFYQMAISEYKKFIESYPKSELLHEAYFGIAESLFFSKTYKEAIDGYENYLTLFPEGEKGPVSTMRIGESYFLAGNHEKSFSYLTSVNPEELDSNFLQTLYFYTGKVYGARKDTEKMLEFFEKTAKAPGESEYSGYALIEIGDTYREASEHKKAIGYYERSFKTAGSDKIRGLAIYKQAETYFSSGNYAIAADKFKQVLEEFPDEEIARDSLANLLLSLFNISGYANVISEFHKNSKLVDEDAKFFSVYYIVAFAHAELSEYDKALSILDKALSFDSLTRADRHKALLKKSEMLLKIGFFNEAVELIEKELKGIETEKDYVLFLKAEAEYGLGDFKDAYNIYNRVYKDFPESPFADDSLYGMAYAKSSDGDAEEGLRFFIEYFKKGKDSARRQEALYKAILLSKKLGLNAKAIEYSEAYLSTLKTGSQNEKVMFQMGVLYSEEKKYDRASEVFRRFINQFEKSERLREAYFLLAYSLQLSENYDEALKYYGKISPDSEGEKLFYSSLKNKALIYFNKGEDDKAAKVFEEIIAKFEDNDLGADTYLWLAQHYLGDKNPEGVLRVLEELEKKPDAGTRTAEIEYFRAEAYREKKDFEKAIKSYDIVLGIDKKGVEKGASRIGKALSLVKMNDFDAARSEFEKAIDENPHDNTVTMRARFEMAGIEKLAGNNEEAGKLYMLVAILYKDDYYCPEALLRAGELFEALDRKKEAIKAYGEILDTYKESHAYEKAKKKIGVLHES